MLHVCFNRKAAQTLSYVGKYVNRIHGTSGYLGRLKQSCMWQVDCQGQEMVRIGNILGARFCLLAGLALVIGAHWADSWLKALTFAK